MKPDAFPFDLTDDEWAAVEPLIPVPGAGGRKRRAGMRDVVNAIRYLPATQCGWRKLPARFPNRSTVRHYYDVWREAGIWDRIVATLHPTSPSPDSPVAPVGEHISEPGGGTS